jgi:hypothetical protein
VSLLKGTIPTLAAGARKGQPGSLDVASNFTCYSCTQRVRNKPEFIVWHANHPEPPLMHATKLSQARLFITYIPHGSLLMQTFSMIPKEPSPSLHCLSMGQTHRTSLQSGHRPETKKLSDRLTKRWIIHNFLPLNTELKLLQQ